MESSISIGPESFVVRVEIAGDDKMSSDGVVTASLVVRAGDDEVSSDGAVTVEEAEFRSR